MKKFKITFIGAGSIGFTRGLLKDILSVPELQNIDVAFMDINQRNLDMVYQLCQRDSGVHMSRRTAAGKNHPIQSLFSHDLLLPF